MHADGEMSSVIVVVCGEYFLWFIGVAVVQCGVHGVGFLILIDLMNSGFSALARWFVRSGRWWLRRS